MAEKIDLRDSPPPLGAFVIGKNTLVAITTSSRRAKSFNAPPTICSEVPSEYAFAVSKKLMPKSRARRISGRLSGSGSVQGWSPRSGTPKVMQPRQSLETCKPVEPKLTYFIRLQNEPHKRP